MARIDLTDREDLPANERDLLASLSATDELPDAYRKLIETPEREIYRAVGRLPPVLEPFRTFGRTIWTHCGIAARRRELAILTVARELDAPYEWHQHVRIGLREGLTPGEIRAIGRDDSAPFSDDDCVLIRYVQGYTAGDIGDEQIAAFVETFDEPAVVGVSLLAGLYVSVALFADALDLEPEEPFVGWELSRLDA